MKHHSNSKYDDIIQTVAPLWPWNHLRFWDLYYQRILPQLELEREVIPHQSVWFKALELLPPERVRVVIIGQDPYHTHGVANGLAFSVRPDVKGLPPSLRNIFKEYQNDTGLPEPRTGDLTRWAENGVLLLNSALTVRPGEPGSHRSIGWGSLAYEVVRYISSNFDRKVFILWGKDAAQYEGAIEKGRGHLCIKSPHPSPYSAKSGFFGSRPFTRASRHLGVTPESLWKLPT